MRASLLVGALLLALPAFSQTAAPAGYPPPGKLINIGGTRVHLYCTGQGPITTMIVGAGYSFDWALVQSGIARFARVCTYDPSGSVWSDPNPSPTCDGRIREIHAMLQAAGITGPLVLVGHSIGAAFARLYAARFPNSVQGMVLVDHAGAYRIPNAAGMFRSEEQALQKLPPLSRDMHRWANSRPAGSNPGPFYDRCIAEAAKTILARPDPLGDKPLVVIANTFLAGSEDYQRFLPTLLALSHNSKAMGASHTGHDVPMENPEVIVQAVREVLSAIQNHSALQ